MAEEVKAAVAASDGKDVVDDYIGGATGGGGG